MFIVLYCAVLIPMDAAAAPFSRMEIHARPVRDFRMRLVQKTIMTKKVKII